MQFKIVYTKIGLLAYGSKYKMNKKVLIALLLVTMTGSVIGAAPAKKQLKLTKNVVVEAKNKAEILKTKKETVALLLENLRYDEAKKSIEELLIENIEDLDANIYLNTYLIGQNRLNEAQENIDGLIEKYPNNSELYFLQGLLYLKRPETSDMSYRKNSKYYYDSGVEAIQRAIELDKDNYKAYNALGVALMSAGNQEKAEEAFKTALKIKQDYATGYDNLGTLYYQQGNYQTAEARFYEAIARNPYCYTAHYHLARLNAKNGEYTNALSYVEKTLLINPKFAHAYNLAGEIYAKQQNDAAAIVNFRKAIELTPEYTTPYLNLAKIYENRSDNEFALESLKTIAGMDKNTDAICLKIADLELAKGNFTLAEKYYSAVKDDSEYKDEAIKGLTETYWLEAQELINKAQTGASQNKLYEAREKLIAAINTSPSDIELRLAKLKLDKLLNSQLSDKECEDIINSTPQTIAEYVVKGEVYSLQGEYISAKEEFEKALDIAKNVTEYKYLAEYFTFAKNYQLALATLNKAELLAPTDKQIQDNKNFVNNKINKSDEYLQDAIYFKKEGDKFFTKKYLLSAVEENPTNVEANILLAKFHKKAKNLQAECNCYKQILSSSSEEKLLSKYLKKIEKLERKIQKAQNKESLWERVFG